MAIASTFRKIFSFLNPRGNGAFDSQLKDEIKSSQSLTQKRREEQRFQRTLERDAKAVSRSTNKENAGLRKIAGNLSPDVKAHLERVWHDAAQVKKDQSLIISGDIPPNKEAQLTQRDKALEEDSLEQIVLAQQALNSKGDKDTVKKIAPIGKRIAKASRLIKSEGVLENAEIQDEKESDMIKKKAA